jgi:hypothetical protein
MNPETEVIQVPGVVTPEAEEADDLPKQTLSANEAIDRIRRGIALVNVRVEKLAFRGEFPHPIHLKRCTLVQPRFDGATFQAEVKFDHCVIDRPHFGKKCDFNGDLYLGGCKLHKFQMTRVTVKGGFNAEYATAYGKFFVNHCVFEGRVRFWEMRFVGWTEFQTCEFRQECDFRSFHAEEGFVFKDCGFLDNVLLRGSAVHKKFDATNSRFEAMLDFSKAKLHDYCYLENIQQGQKQRFGFMNTLGERIRIRTPQLEGRLASEQAGDYVSAMHEYAFLKCSFQSLHRYDQEDWAFYRFKVNQRRSVPRSWAKPWTKVAQFIDWLLLDHGCGYCTDPFRAVRTALCIILFFAVFYAIGIDTFRIDPERVPFEGGPTGILNRSVIGLFKSVAIFTSGLSSISEMSKGWMNVPLIIESLLGTLLWGLFIVAFSRKVIR